MIGFLFALWSMVYGMSFGNVAPWAAAVRAVLAVLLALAGLAWLWRARPRLDLAQALITGLLVAAVISNSFHSTGNYGFANWLVFAGAYGLQRLVLRDWRNDVAVFGLTLSLYVMLNFLAGQAPSGPLNRNYVSLLIVLAAPAMMARWPVAGWLVPCSAILISGARGALVGMHMFTVVMVDISRRLKFIFAAIGLAGGISLISIRTWTVGARLALARAALSDWWATSPVWGLGPGGIAVEGWRVGEPFVSHHAHNVWISILAQVGLVGIVLIVLCSLASLWASHIPNLARWQWAALAASGVLSFVEDLAVWWPVLILIAIMLVEIPCADQRTSLAACSPAQS